MEENLEFPDLGSGGWNHRVATRVFSYKQVFVNNPKLAKMKDQRLFSIIEVYYDKDGNPTGYVDTKNHLTDWEDMDDLKGTYEMIASAFTKPIIDLDNFPNEWKDE